MYDLINAYVGDVLKSIPPVDIRDYASLVQNLTQTQVAAPTFQKKYTTYWGMRFPCPAWLAVYFQSLQNAVLNPPTLRALLQHLYNTPTTAKGRTVECSFATKLLTWSSPGRRSMIQTWLHSISLGTKLWASKKNRSLC